MEVAGVYLDSPRTSDKRCWVKNKWAYFLTDDPKFPVLKYRYLGKSIFRRTFFICPIKSHG